MPLGVPVGIYIKTKGVLVLGTGEVTDIDGRKMEPAANILRSGDYILEADGKQICSTDELTGILEEWKGGDLLLNVLRGNDETALRMTPVRTADSNIKSVHGSVRMPRESGHSVMWILKIILEPLDMALQMWIPV